MLATEPKDRPLRGEYGSPVAWGWWGALARLGRALSSRGMSAAAGRCAGAGGGGGPKAAAPTAAIGAPAGESTTIATTPDGFEAAPAGAGLTAPACDAPPTAPMGAAPPESDPRGAGSKVTDPE